MSEINNCISFLSYIKYQLFMKEPPPALPKEYYHWGPFPSRPLGFSLLSLMGNPPLVTGSYIFPATSL